MPASANPIEAFAVRLTGEEAAALVALVGLRTRPGKPTIDEPRPYVAIWQVEGGGLSRLNGRRRTQPYGIRVEVFADTQGAANRILDAARPLLDGWSDRSIGVQSCFAQGDAGEQTYEDGSQGFGQTFTVWWTQ